MANVSLPDARKRQLEQQLRSDPRVLAYANQHRSGNQGVVNIPADVLRSLGYDVADNWRLIFGSTRGPDQFVMSDGIPSWMERAVNIGANTLTGYAAGTFLNDALNGAGGAASAVDDAAPNISTPEGYANAVNLGASNPVDPGFLPSATGTNPVTFRPGGGTTPIPSTTPTTGAPQTSQGVADQVRNLMDSPRDWAALAALLPMLGLGGGGASPFDEDTLNAELTKGLEAQRKRFEQAQPVYDTLVNMAYGMSPTRYRGAAPTGYPKAAQQPADGAYRYQSPRFG